MENTLQKALQHRLSSHPEDFHDVVRSLNTTYKNICHIRDTQPKDALVQLKGLIQTINTLLALPTDIKLPIPNETWRSQLHQIIDDCQNKCDDLQKVIALASNNSQHTVRSYDTALPDTILAPWIQDWLDPTLQTRAVKRLVYHTVVPIMFPSAHTAAFPNKPTSAKDISYPHMLLLNGPSHTGKSYAIQAVRRYLKDHQAPVRWVMWSAFECADAAQKQLKYHSSIPLSNSESPSHIQTENESIIPNEWTVYVTDNVSSQDFAHWTEQAWFRAWDQWLSKQPRTLWIVSVTIEHANGLNGLAQGVPVQIPFKYPDGRTLYHLFRKLLLRQYGHVRLPNGTLEPPSYARLPIIHEFDRLASFCDHIATSGVSFATIERVFQHTVRHCTRLAMLENVVYKQPGIEWWYPKNSVQLAALKSDYDYRLIYPLVHDKIEWCPAQKDQMPTQCSVDTTTFWNVQLLDTLPTSEYERLAHVYMDPDSVHDKDSPTYQVIANFPVKTRVFPYHLHDGFDRCYEWTIAMWLATVTKNKASERLYRTLLSTDDVCTLPSTVQDTFFDASTLPLQFEDITDAHQVLYIEHETYDGDTPDDSSTVPNVHIYSGECSSRTIDEFVEGVPGNINATTMQKILQVVLNDLDVDVIQVQTHAGYAYYIDVGNPMEHPLRVEAVDPEATRVSLMPRVTLLATSGGPHLDATYRLTCESDVDALTEAFPREYKEIFREEESTWKLMKPRDASHLALLNRKYSHETKFYLKIFGDLLQAKRRHYSCLNYTQRETLDHSIVDLQNFLDYHLLLIGEDDQNGDWNQVWSMSPTHPAYEAYHPPAHNEVDKVVAVDLAIDWMKKDMQYFVSPRWLEPFYMLATNFNGKLRHMTTHESDSIVALSPMQHLFRTWKWYKREPVKENTHWIYVKSVVNKQAWANSMESTSCLKRAFPHMHNTTTLPEAFGGSPGNPNRGGHEDDSSVDDVYTSTKDTTNLPRQSTDSVLPCLQDASYMQTYASRTTKSLFHTLMRHASYLGRHDDKENVIHWYEIKQGQEDDPLDTTVAHLGRHQDVWALLSKNCTYGHAVCHPWLFTLNMCTLCEGKPGVPVPPKGGHLNYHELYAHLLAFPTLHYWSLEGGDNILTDIQEQGIWDHTVCQYAFVHKHVHRRPLPLHGPFPQSFERNCVVPTTHVSLSPSTSHGTKSVIPEDALSKIRVYGCSMHHLEDCWQKMSSQ